MALGAAHMLGYKLCQNFNMPYLAVNVSEFWRRWHISLSSWLRDYLFIPLGGSRGTPRQTERNLLITMTLGGLWHGASWTFVVWGMLHGGLLIVHRRFRGVCDARPRLDSLLQTWPGRALATGVTFLSVCVGWVFFRATSFPLAATMLHRLAVPHRGISAPLRPVGFLVTAAVVILCHALAQRGVGDRLAARVPIPVRGLAFGGILTLILLIAPQASKAFIYFQF
jgi:alginate O-acetyltransferase complex protein AlgI